MHFSANYLLSIKKKNKKHYFGIILLLFSKLIYKVFKCKELIQK